MPIFATISGTISNTISSVVQLVADAYPQLGRVLDLAGFSFGNPEAPDISSEDNDAVLYSGKGVNLDGTGDYVELPNVGATKSITVLVRSGTSSTLYATDDAGQTEDASVSLTADSTWQTVTLTFTNAISGAIRLGTDGASSYTGDLAHARLYDASSNLLDEFYLNEHTDTAANGLDGLPVVGRNGNVGQYVGCAAIVQEGMDSALAGLGAYAGKLWFDGVDDYLQQAYAKTTGNVFTLSFSFVFSESLATVFDKLIDIQGAASEQILLDLRDVSGSWAIGGAYDDGTNRYVIDTFTSNVTLVDGTLYNVSVVIDIDNDTAIITTNGVTDNTTSIPALTTFSVTQAAIGASVGGVTNYYHGLITSVDIESGELTWDGTISDATTQGWTVNGSPNSIAELRKQPPQVLGLNFNRYSAVTPTPVLDPAGAILVSESFNAGIDALGNTLTSRTSKTFNADGSGYALVPDADSLDLTTEATWVFYTRNPIVDNGSTAEFILSKSSFTDANTDRSWVFVLQDGDLKMWTYDSIGTFSSRQLNLSDFDSRDVNVIAFTYNAGTVNIYLNGSFVRQSTTAPASLNATVRGVGILADPASGTSLLDTPVSDVKIYNRELTADEVATFA